ncbi:MAG: response regulator, partial [Gammaproteobacteria bacterium]|nr:response regulator [Gammaproteobacteria bacterium]
GKLNMEKVPFRLNEVMDNLANIVSVAAENKDIEVLFNIDENVPNGLVGDPLRIGQILINLSNNAVKFTEHGEVIISCKVVASKQDTVDLQFAVRDSGIGMTAEQRDKLFQAFTQADTSTSRKYGGTGLGLTISKRLVEMMHGEIQVQSEDGRGSEFSFSINFGIAPEEYQSGMPAMEDLQGLHALVVDDNPNARMVMEHQLQGFGLETKAVDSGQAAINEIRRAVEAGEPGYELVFMDWSMPDMDGFEAIKKIRLDARQAKQPAIIMVTAFGHEQIRHKAESSTLDGFLIKPVTPMVLVDTIRVALGKELEKSAEQPGSQVSMATGLKGKRVLVVEDNIVNRQVAKEILKGAGIQVELAENGIEALEQVKALSGSLDAVLMDIQMPEMDGLEATRHIRNDLAQTELPIIAMTASVMQSDQDACIEAGMNDVVGKPVDVDQLFSALAKWMTTNTKVSDAATSPAPKTPPEILPGIDVPAVLKRLGGNQKLLHTLLLQFSEDNQAIGNNIREAIQQGDMKLAERLAHTLKGVAGNLGITDVFTAAEELNLALVENDTEHYEELITNLEKTLEPVFDGLKNIEQTVKTSSKKDTSPPVVVDKVMLTKQLQDLDKLLNSHNLNAGKELENLRPSLAGAGADGQLDELSRNIELLDFDAAHKVLGKLAESLQITLHQGRQT